jgi:hypothetical protein
VWMGRSASRRIGGLVVQAFVDLECKGDHSSLRTHSRSSAGVSPEILTPVRGRRGKTRRQSKNLDAG